MLKVLPDSPKNLDRERDRLRSRLLAFSNDVNESHLEIEDRFQQTIGLARALEAASADPAARAIAAAIRADYEALLAQFAALEERNSDDLNGGYSYDH